MINYNFFEHKKKLRIFRRSSFTTACCIAMLSRKRGWPECIPIRSFNCSSGRCRILNFFTSLSNVRAIRAMCTAWANPLRIGSPETHCKLGQSCVRKTVLHNGTTVGSLIFTRSRDSISTVLCHSTPFERANEQGGATVEIESRDRVDMREPTVAPCRTK